jgi:hypothetical protein
MRTRVCIGSLIGGLAAGYATYAAVTWTRYGHPRRGDEEQPTLDRFMGDYEVVERHEVRVAAPADITFSAACDMELEDSLIIRSIFKARELVMGGVAAETAQPRGLVEQTKALGWRALGEIPGREIVMGAVTQPWMPNPIFRPVPPDEFAAFEEPDYVKIVWNLRADPVSPVESIFTTETRAATTDAGARAKFRVYWSFASPGIWLIRRLTLGPLRREAERRFRGGEAAMPDDSSAIMAAEKL